MEPRTGLLKHLASLPWPNPGQVQVQILIHDEEDDCFDLWMIHDGRPVEVPLPRTQRFHSPAPSSQVYAPSPGYLWRTDGGSSVPAKLWTERQDPRPAWQQLSRAIGVRDLNAALRPVPAPGTGAVAPVGRQWRWPGQCGSTQRSSSVSPSSRIRCCRSSDAPDSRSRTAA